MTYAGLHHISSAIHSTSKGRFSNLWNSSGLFKALQTIFKSNTNSWSLDFLQLSGLVSQFCVIHKLLDLDVLLLNFVRSVTFPFLLAIFMYCLIQLYMWNCRVVVLFWRPFHLCFGRIRRNFSASDKAIHAFASLWLLSL